MIKRIEELKKEITAGINRKERLQGVIDANMEKLKELGFTDIEEAKKEAEKLKKEITKKEQKIEKLITEIERELEC